MEREQFTFYASFAQAVQKIRNKQARCDAYDAIVNYALRGEEPEPDKLPDIAEVVFMMAKPVLDSSKRKAENGRKGGQSEQNESKDKEEANGKQTGSKPEANGKQTGSEKEDKKEGEKEGKKEKENKCSLPPLTPQRRDEMIGQGLDGRSGQLVIAVGDWVQYKIERREPYQETGLRNLISQIRKAAEQHGDNAVIDVIRNSMGSGYKGILFDRLGREKPKQVTTASEYKPPAPKSAEEIYGIVDRI